MATKDPPLKFVCWLARPFVLLGQVKTTSRPSAEDKTAAREPSATPQLGQIYIFSLARLHTIHSLLENTD